MCTLATCAILCFGLPFFSFLPAICDKRARYGSCSRFILFLGNLTLAMFLSQSVYLIILFRLNAVPFSFFCLFLSLCVAFVFLALAFLSGLSSAAYITAFHG